MANDQRDRLVDTLLRQGSSGLVDLKFLRGSNPIISEGAFVEQVLGVMNQRKLGLTKPMSEFHEALHVVDLKELVGDL